MCAEPTVPSRNFVPHLIIGDGFPIGFAADAEQLTGLNPAYKLRASSCTGVAGNAVVNSGVESAPFIVASFKVHWVSLANGVCDGEESERGEEEDGRKLHLFGKVVKGSSIWTLTALKCYVLYLLRAASDGKIGCLLD